MGSAAPSKKPVVLVVEDEALILTCALAMVEAAGFEPIAAADASEAIGIPERRNDIRAVFTDIQMPGSMDRLRLARVIRNRWPPVALIITHRPVLAHCDRTTTRVRRQGFHAGAPAAPVDPSRSATSLARTLPSDGRRALPTQRSKRALPISGALCLRALPLTSVSLLSTKPKNGPR